MTEPTFEVISLGPSADGWRAIFSGDNGAVAEPLVCWAAFRKKAPGQPDETLISGVCADSSPGGPVRFLVPGQQRPTSRATSRRATPTRPEPDPNASGDPRVSPQPSCHQAARRTEVVVTDPNALRCLFASTGPMPRRRSLAPLQRRTPSDRRSPLAACPGGPDRHDMTSRSGCWCH